MKKEFVVAVNYAKYLAFVLATACVLVCQFTGNLFWVSMSLNLYVVAFGLMFFSMVIHANEVFTADRIIKENNLKEGTIEPDENGEIIINTPGELQGKEVEKVNLKAEKFWSVAGAIFFGVFTLFTLVVSILF